MDIKLSWVMIVIWAVLIVLIMTSSGCTYTPSYGTSDRVTINGYDPTLNSHREALLGRKGR